MDEQIENWSALLGRYDAPLSEIEALYSFLLRHQVAPGEGDPQFAQDFIDGHDVCEIEIYDQTVELPPSIGLLRELTKLECAHTGLVTLPKTLGDLSSLRELNLRGNKITQLPVELGRLHQLETLNLDFNKLSSLPTEIGQLQALRELRLLTNELTSLPKEIGLLQKLEWLDLTNAPLESLAEEVWQLRSLSVFCLTGVSLHELPKSVSQLSQLTHLESAARSAARALRVTTAQNAQPTQEPTVRTPHVDRQTCRARLAAAFEQPARHTARFALRLQQARNTLARSQSVTCVTDRHGPVGFIVFSRPRLQSADQPT